MTRSEMLDVLKTNLCEMVESVNEAEVVDPANMVELGADSLEVVEVTVRTMRQLGVRVPRTELSGVTNVGELLTLFERAEAGAYAART
jgi:acyl carrier protein